MDLDQYLSLPGAPSTVEFARRLNLNSDQIRQWRHRHAKRRPSPQNSVLIEQITGGAIRRWDLRPDDWHAIWPELVNAPGAPAVPAEQES